MRDLPRLPLLDKATAIEHQHALRVGPSLAGIGYVSSGTTRKRRPLNVVVSEAEEAAIADGALAAGKPAKPRDWSLTVVSVTHGLPKGPLGPRELQLPWMYDRNAFHMLDEVLSKPQSDGRRVRSLRISVGALKSFAAWCLENDRDARRFGLRAIGTNSFRLSPFWRDFLAEQFGAELYDNYSLSEFATPATECKACGWLHLGWPPIVYELLDLKTGKQKKTGVGKLVLTGLHPFVQAMPLVRYDTGDIVEVGPRCSVAGVRGLRHLGRKSRGLVVGADFLLAPSNVQDLLEPLPEAARTPHPCVKLGYIRSVDIGLPRWEVALDKGRPATARLRFEVNFEPAIHRRHADGLEREVRRGLLRLEPALRRLRLVVTACAPGTLTPPPDKWE